MDANIYLAFIRVYSRFNINLKPMAQSSKAVFAV